MPWGKFCSNSLVPISTRPGWSEPSDLDSCIWIRETRRTAYVDHRGVSASSLLFSRKEDKAFLRLPTQPWHCFTWYNNPPQTISIGLGRWEKLETDRGLPPKQWLHPRTDWASPSYVLVRSKDSNGSLPLYMYTLLIAPLFGSNSLMCSAS